MVRILLLAVALLSLAACVHKVVVPVVVPVLVPIPEPVIRWTLPLEADDETPFCVATSRAGGVDPSNVLPLRCVSVGAVRFWIRAQRLAND